MISNPMNSFGASWGANLLKVRFFRDTLYCHISMEPKIFDTKMCEYGIFVAKMGKYGIFVAQICKYDIFCREILQIRAHR